MTGLLHIYTEAARNVRQHHIAWAEAQGIARRTLIEVGLFGVAGVRFSGTTFEFDDAGPQAVISPVGKFADRGPLVGVGLETVDLVAWLPRQPDRFAAYLGRTVLLGDAFELEPLPVWRNPLSWLRAGGEGVVVLDQARAWAEFAALDVPLLAEDVQHGRELRRLLMPPKAIVEILVPRAEAA